MRKLLAGLAIGLIACGDHPAAEPEGDLLTDPSVVSALPAELQIADFVRPDYRSRFPLGCRVDQAGLTREVLVPLPGGDRLMVLTKDSRDGALNDLLLHRRTPDGNNFYARLNMRRSLLGIGWSGATKEYDLDSVEGRYVIALANLIRNSDCDA